MIEKKGQTVQDLNEAPYNPRSITPEALSGLKDSLYVFGDLSGFVWNEKSGNIVCGHQRKKALDGVTLTEIKWSEEYEVELGPKHNRFKSKEQDGHFVSEAGVRFRIRKVRWEDGFEKAANVAANDPRIQGVFESTMLHSVIDEIQSTMPELSEVMDFRGLQIDEKIAEDKPPVKEELKAYERVHVLLSFPVGKAGEILGILEQLKGKPYVQWRQSAN